MPPFPPPLTGSEQDETGEFRPRFDANGLIGAIVQDAATGQVLMFAWMNAQALGATMETGLATFWSRSRGALWVKGETSGHRLRVVQMRVDCDQDALLLKVVAEGPACHTGRTGCFYRVVDTPRGLTLSLLSESD